MITIRSADAVTEPTLVGIKATLTTESGVYSLSCAEPLLNGSTPLAGGLFGSIAWPRSRFRIAPSVMLEQQAFLPHDSSAAAFSWQLCGGCRMPVHLQVRPLFAGCNPRSYRDIGFRFQSPEAGGRLTWLPGVLGPTIIADTNGRYRASNHFGNDAPDSEVIDAGVFEFQVSNRPSVLILTNDRISNQQNRSLLGIFLAGLMPSALKFCGVSETSTDVITPALAA